MNMNLTAQEIRRMYALGVGKLQQITTAMPYKKNTQATYTPSMSGTLRTIKEYAPLFIQIGTVLALLLAAYIASTLRPLYEDIRTLAGKVQAIEES